MAVEYNTHWCKCLVRGITEVIPIGGDKNVERDEI